MWFDEGRSQHLCCPHSVLPAQQQQKSLNSKIVTDKDVVILNTNNPVSGVKTVGMSKHQESIIIIIIYWSMRVWSL